METEYTAPSNVQPCISIGCLLAETPQVPLNPVQPVEKWDGYECIEVLVDSGAGECVCGPQHFESFAMSSDPTRANAHAEYVTADGGRIPNLGEKHVVGMSDFGANMAINFQVSSVDKPLIAVSMLTAAGHEVTFGQTGGVVHNKVTGRKTPFTKKHNVYVMNIWVKTSGNGRQ